MLFYFMSKNKKNINNNQFDAARKYVMTWWVVSLVKMPRNARFVDSHSKRFLQI